MTPFNTASLVLLLCLMPVMVFGMLLGRSGPVTRDDILRDVSTLPVGIQLAALKEAEMTAQLGLLHRRKLREIVDVYRKLAAERGIV